MTVEDEKEKSVVCQKYERDAWWGSTVDYWKGPSDWLKKYEMEDQMVHILNGEIRPHTDI